MPVDLLLSIAPAPSDGRRLYFVIDSFIGPQNIQAIQELSEPSQTLKKLETFTRRPALTHTARGFRVDERPRSMGVCAAFSLQVLPRQCQRLSGFASLNVRNTSPFHVLHSDVPAPPDQTKARRFQRFNPTPGSSFAHAPVYKHVGIRRCPWDCL